MKCETCGEIVIPVEGVTTIFRRGMWWHVKCCDFDFIDGKPELTEFPSNGKLIPKSILTED